MSTFAGAAIMLYLLVFSSWCYDLRLVGFEADVWNSSGVAT